MIEPIPYEKVHDAIRQRYLRAEERRSTDAVCALTDLASDLGIVIETRWLVTMESEEAKDE